MRMDTDPELSADRLLAAYWRPGALPVDPYAIADALSVEVREGELALNLSSALIKEPDGEPFILLSKKDSKAWKRFSCAYEIGAYMQHKEEKSFHLSFDRRKPAEDAFACGLATNLLMPKEDLYDIYSGTKILWDLARRFGVSPRTMKTRLEELKLDYTE